VTAFTIVVPCSTSNLGAGFDAIGLSLGGPDLLVRATPGGSGLRIVSLSGEGSERLARDSSNRVVQAAWAAARAAGADPRELSAELELHSSIPLARGLGSSAAAAVAGTLLADRLLGGRVGEERALQVAVELEGHPDNVLPSLRGGLQVAVRDARGTVLSCAVSIGTAVKAALFIPDEELATSAARAVLPREVPLADAVFNLSRAALFVAAMSAGRLELLRHAMDDRLHQPARTSLLPWLPAILGEALAAGAAGAALSGAGTTVCALCAPENAPAVVRALSHAGAGRGVQGRCELVDVGVPGAQVT
jgi:homoserine kinase